MEKLITLGILAIIIGIILIFIGTLFQAAKPSKSAKPEVRSAGIVFIGPFPIGWASDKQTFQVILAVVAMVIIFYLIFLRKI